MVYHYRDTNWTVICSIIYDVLPKFLDERRRFCSKPWPILVLIRVEAMELEEVFKMVELRLKWVCGTIWVAYVQSSQNTLILKDHRLRWLKNTEFMSCRFKTGFRYSALYWILCMVLVLYTMIWSYWNIPTIPLFNTQKIKFVIQISRG